MVNNEDIIMLKNQVYMKEDIANRRYNFDIQVAYNKGYKQGLEDAQKILLENLES